MHTHDDGLRPDWPTVADARVMALPVQETGEPLQRIDPAATGLWLDDSAANLAHLGYATDFRLRVSVVQRLARAAAALPAGVRLLVKEAYRPLTVQQRYFDRYLLKLRALHPALDPVRDAEALRQLAARFIAPPDCATHVTGGAVDVTLADADSGLALDLGTPYDASPELSEQRCFTGATHISAAAYQHRQWLITAMQSQGFVNYPYEWWHWSWGDRYWAHLAAQPAALFGAVSAEAEVAAEPACASAPPSGASPAA